MGHGAGTVSPVSPRTVEAWTRGRIGDKHAIQPRAFMARATPRSPETPWRTGIVLDVAPKLAVSAAWTHWAFAVHAKDVLPVAVRYTVPCSLAAYLKTGPIRRYAYLDSARAVVSALQRDVGPVVVGGHWTTEMDHPDPDGYISTMGRVLGTSAFVVVAYAAKRRAFRVQPAFGVGWGQAGRAWLPYLGLDHLLDRGEAIIAESL
jgi:hypothetical protein